MTNGATLRGMRKGLTRYGDEGFSLFLRKAFIKAMGFSDDALDRPIVGIADTGSDYNACHANVPRLVDAVRRGVMLADGLPMAIGTIVLHVTPESAIGGPLALVETGDRIRLDVGARRLDLLVPEEEIAARRERWSPPPAHPGSERGYLCLFLDTVTGADRDFDFMGPPTRLGGTGS